MTSRPTDLPRVRSRSTTLPPIPTEYDRLEALYEVQTVLVQPIGIAQACDELLPIVTRALPVRTAVLIDTSRELRRAFMWAAPGLSRIDVETARDRARETHAYLVRDPTPPVRVVERDGVLSGGVSVRSLGARQFVTLPLAVPGHVFGVFQLEGAIELDERDLLFVNAVTNQIAIALQRQRVELELANSRSALELANRRLQDLQTISEAALRGATLDQSLAAVLRAMCPMFAADAAAVLLVSADRKTLARRASVGLADADDAQVSIGVGAAGRIAASGTVMVFDDRDEVDGVSSELQRNGIRSLLGAPMRARNQVTGVVQIASLARRAFTRDEQQFLELVADRIGTIIDNASLYEQALASIRSRDAVMGVVSHDLRNPLSAIQMAAELLESDAPELTKPLSIIRSSADVMARLIGDLRDIASIEVGHLSTSARSEDAGALVRDAVDGVRTAAAKKQLLVETRLPARELVLDCDRVRVIQVLTNLISNAIKFTPAAGSITVSVAEAALGFARISVEDTGCGIPEADLSHVFEPYWQATATAHLGTGLGLAIAAGIVAAHGGTMSVESSVGHGSTFSFTLPLANHAMVSRSIPAHRPTVPRAGYRVLVVDDDPNSLSALAALLRDEGFVVDTAIDGLQALSKVQELSPEVLIVDIELPGLSGLDVVRRLRGELNEVPVILMTGQDDQDSAAAQRELGASLVSKPIEIRELISALHRELRKDR